MAKKKDKENYNYAAAIKAGLKPGPDGHWQSVDPTTSYFLKSKQHPTLHKEIDWFRNQGMVGSFGPATQKIVTDPTGYFGEDQLRYIPIGDFVGPSEYSHGGPHSTKNIRALQKLLKEQGYNPGAIDNAWGPKTEEALKSFLKDNPNRSIASIAEYLPKLPLPAKAFVDDFITSQLNTLPVGKANYDAITRGDLSSNQLEALQKIVRKNLKEGKTSISYSDYGTDSQYGDVGPSASSGNILKQLVFSPEYNLKTTLGQADIVTTPTDTLVVDQYNFNEGQGSSVFNPFAWYQTAKEIGMKPSLYTVPRKIASQFGSQEGEGAPAIINTTEYSHGGKHDPPKKKKFTGYEGPEFDPYEDLSFGSDNTSVNNYILNALKEQKTNPIDPVYQDKFAQTVAEWSPISGEIIDAGYTADALSQGNYVDAALYGAGFMLPFIPGKTIKKGFDFIKNKIPKKSYDKVNDFILKKQDQLRTKTGMNNLIEQELTRNPNLTRDQARDIANKQIDKLSDMEIVIDPKKKDAYYPRGNTLVLKSADDLPVIAHEVTHATDAGLVKPSREGFDLVKEWVSDPTIQNRIRSGFTFKDNLTKKASNALEYFKTGSRGREATTFLSEFRQHLVNNKFLTFGKDGYFKKVTPEMLKKAFNNLTKNPSKNPFREGTRIFDFIENTPKNLKHLADEINVLPATVPVVAGSAAYKMNANNEVPEEGFKYGGQVMKYNNGGETDPPTGGLAQTYNLQPAMDWHTQRFNNPFYQNRLRKEYANAHGINLSDQGMSDLISGGLNQLNIGGNQADLFQPISEADNAEGYTGTNTWDPTVGGYMTNDYISNPLIGDKMAPNAGQIAMNPNWNPDRHPSVAIHEVGHRYNALTNSPFSSSRNNPLQDESAAYHQSFFNKPWTQGHYKTEMRDDGTEWGSDKSAYFRSPHEISSYKAQWEDSMQRQGIWNPMKSEFDQGNLRSLLEQGYGKDMGYNFMGNQFTGLGLNSFSDYMRNLNLDSYSKGTEGSFDDIMVPLRDEKGKLLPGGEKVPRGQIGAMTTRYERDDQKRYDRFQKILGGSKSNPIIPEEFMPEDPTDAKVHGMSYLMDPYGGPGISMYDKRREWAQDNRDTRDLVQGSRKNFRSLFNKGFSAKDLRDRWGVGGEEVLDIPRYIQSHLNPEDRTGFKTYWNRELESNPELANAFERMSSVNKEMLDKYNVPYSKYDNYNININRNIPEELGGQYGEPKWHQFGKKRQRNKFLKGQGQNIADFILKGYKEQTGTHFGKDKRIVTDALRNIEEGYFQTKGKDKRASDKHLRDTYEFREGIQSEDWMDYVPTKYKDIGENTIQFMNEVAMEDQTSNMAKYGGQTMNRYKKYKQGGYPKYMASGSTVGLRGQSAEDLGIGTPNSGFEIGKIMQPLLGIASTALTGNPALGMGIGELFKPVGEQDLASAAMNLGTGIIDGAGRDGLKMYGNKSILDADGNVIGVDKVGGGMEGRLERRENRRHRNNPYPLAMGGDSRGQIEAEGGEFFVSDDGNAPISVGAGELTEVAEDMYKLGGPSHDAGGMPIEAPEGYVHTKRFLSNKPLGKKYKAKNDSQVAENIAKEIAKLEAFGNSKEDIETKVRMQQQLEKELMALRDSAEQYKAMKGIDSEGKAIAKYGKHIKYEHGGESNSSGGRNEAYWNYVLNNDPFYFSSDNVRDHQGGRITERGAAPSSRVDNTRVNSPQLDPEYLRYMLGNQPGRETPFNAEEILNPGANTYLESTRTDAPRKYYYPPTEIKNSEILQIPEGRAAAGMAYGGYMPKYANGGDSGQIARQDYSKLWEEYQDDYNKLKFSQYGPAMINLLAGTPDEIAIDKPVKEYEKTDFNPMLDRYLRSIETDERNLLKEVSQSGLTGARKIAALTSASAKGDEEKGKATSYVEGLKLKDKGLENQYNLGMDKLTSQLDLQELMLNLQQEGQTAKQKAKGAEQVFTAMQNQFWDPLKFQATGTQHFNPGGQQTNPYTYMKNGGRTRGSQNYLNSFYSNILNNK